MTINMNNLNVELKKLRLGQDNIEVIGEEILKQYNLYLKLKMNLTNVSFLIIGQRNSDISTIRLFDNNVILEILDTSYTTLKELSSLKESNIEYILKVIFLENGKYIEVFKCKYADVIAMKLKKVKSVIYGVTDGRNVIKIEISQQDIKGTEYDVLKNAVSYTFNKKMGYSPIDLDCISIGYA